MKPDSETLPGIELLGLYAGGVTILEPEGLPSGIIKEPITERRRIHSEGMEGDEQADLRVHGGPEKALHHFAAEHYAALQTRFPLVAENLVPGSIGENISTRGMTENNACIGDVCALGTARLQISQPRRPCWKINSRYQQDGLAQHIERTGCTGWYYRVLEEGTVLPDSTLKIVERPHPNCSIQTLNQLGQQARPDLDQLAVFASMKVLNIDWRNRLQKRLDWLRANT